jgi:hypothetical protein
MNFSEESLCHYRHNLSKMTSYAFFSGARSPMRKILIVDGNADVTRDEFQFNQRDTTELYRGDRKILMKAS